MVADFILAFFAALAGASLVAFIAQAIARPLQKLIPAARDLRRRAVHLFDRSPAATSRSPARVGARVAMRLQQIKAAELRLLALKGESKGAPDPRRNDLSSRKAA